MIFMSNTQPKRSMVQDRSTGFYTVTGEDEGDRGIVFPRRSGHRECDHVCDFCNVCVHRYTLQTYLHFSSIITAYDVDG